MDALLIVAFVLLFQRHLAPSTLFWDEWMYVREIQAMGSAWAWVFVPSTAHVFIPGKALFATLYEMFGFDGAPYKAMALVLHGVTALVLRRLVGQVAGQPLAHLTMAVFLLTPAYEEIVSWPAHYREQFFILFLFCWLLASLKVFRPGVAPGDRRTAAWLGGAAFALMSLSYANVFFSLIFLTIFALAFHRQLLAARFYAILLGGAAILLVGLHFGAFAAPLKAQLAEQNAEVFKITGARIAASLQSALTFTYNGVLAPLARVSASAAATAITVALIAGAFLVGFVREMRAGTVKRTLPALAFFGLACALVIATQVWYRRDIAFLLNWTKYSFFPIALLLPVLAVCARGLGPRGGPALLAVLVVIAVAGDFSKVRRDFTGLSRDARVMELTHKFNATFAAAPANVTALPDLTFPWNIFIPEAAPTLSTLWAASPLTRHRPMRFFDPNAKGDNTFATTLALLPADSAVRSFILDYIPRTERPAAGDAGLSPQLLPGHALVQELIVEGDDTLMTQVVLVAGTGGAETTARLDMEITDARTRTLLRQDIEARTLNNNTPTPVAITPLPVTPGRYFLILRPAADPGAPPLVFYQTRADYAHLGATYACPLARDQTPAACISPRYRREVALGVAFTTTSAPVNR